MPKKVAIAKNTKRSMLHRELDTFVISVRVRCEGDGGKREECENKG